MTDPLARVADLIEQVTGGVTEARIWLAQRRDDMLTEAELIAKLEVCEEFGR